MKLVIDSLITIRLQKGNEAKQLSIKYFYKSLIKIISKELKKNIINEKGMYYIFKIISNIKNYINKEEVIHLFKVIWDYFDSNKNEEPKYPFMSFEFVENIIDESLKFYFKNNENIYKSKDINKEDKFLPNIFNYIIKDYSFGLHLKVNNKIIWKEKCLLNPLSMNENNTIDNNRLYNSMIELTNLSFYKSHDLFDFSIINDNSILFTQSIKNENDVKELSKIIENNNGKISIIIVKYINYEKTFNIEINKFIKNYNIPIYIMQEKIYLNIINYFIEGKGEIYSNDSINRNKELKNNNIIDNLILDITPQKENTDKVANKKEMNLDLDLDVIDLNCLFYNEKQYKEKILKQFEENRLKKYYEFVNKFKKLKIYKIANIKLAKRLLYEILCLDFIQLHEVKNIYGDTHEIISIFEDLYLEYYFNIKNICSYDSFTINEYFSNALLKDRVKNFLLKISLKSTDVKNNINEWLLLYLENLTKFKDNESWIYIDFLNNYDIATYNKENSLFNNNYFSFYFIIYDILLFFSKNCVCLNNKGFPIQKYLEIIENKMDYILKTKKQKDFNYYYDEENYNYAHADNKILKNKNNLEILYLFEIMNNIYDYYIDNKKDSKVLKKYLISSKINLKMRILIEEYINFDEYLYYKKEEEKLTDKKMIKSEITFLIQYSLKYIDFCLYIFLKENKLDLLEYWIQSNSELYNFYCNYKILTLENNINGKDSKEIFSLIAYLTNSIEHFCKKGDNIKSSVEIKLNENKTYIRDNKLNVYHIRDNKNDYLNISIINQNDTVNNMLAILYYDSNDKKFILLDIIDLNLLKASINSYKLKINAKIKEIYLFLLKNINTKLYCLDNTNFNLEKTNVERKYFRNLGYGDNKFLLQSENNDIYTIEGDNLIFEREINKLIEDKKENIYFINQNSNKTVFCLNNKGEVVFISRNKQKYNWLNYIINNKWDFPLKIPIEIDVKVKVSFISANSKNGYIIDLNGNLYGIGDNSYHQINEENIIELKKWTKIALPDNNKRFLQCANGENYLICLVEDNKGRGKIYSKGSNANYECGIKEQNIILKLTQININEEINIKSICSSEFFSSAISDKGELYIWGFIYLRTLGYIGGDEKTIIKSPFLVNKEDNIFVDSISINSKNSTFPVLVIVKKLEKGIYTKKILFLMKTRISLFSKDFDYILYDIKDLNNNEAKFNPLFLLYLL